MKCLYCEKEIIKTNSTELECGWHKHCIKSFFGTNVLPIIDINDEVLNKIVKENVEKGLNVPGVQKKLSLHLTNDKGGAPRLTIVNYPTGYILKPQSEEYISLPENEYLIMSMAKTCGIQTVPFALIKINTHTKYAFITKRIDRVIKKNETIKYAMEDFCQLSNRLTEDKYKSSYEQCAKIINQYSLDKGIDIAEFFYRCIFNYIVGNADMHLKNFSLIENEPANREFHLSKAYDLLSTKLVLKEDKEDTALTLNGKKKNLNKSDWLKFAKTIGLNEKVTMNLIKKCISFKNEFYKMIKNSYLDINQQNELIEIISNHINKLS